VDIVRCTTGLRHRLAAVAQWPHTPDANVNILRASFSRDLVDAARLGDSERVRQLLDAGVAPAIMSVGHGHTALHAAAAYGHEAVVSILLARGCTPDLSNAMGSTPLALVVHAIADNPETQTLEALYQIAHMLLDAGASPKLGPGREHTPLVLARRYGLARLEAVLLPHCDSPYFP